MMMVQLLSSQSDTLLSGLPWQHARSPTGMPAPSQLFRCCLYLSAHRLLMALLLPSVLSDVQIDEAGCLFVLHGGVYAHAHMCVQMCVGQSQCSVSSLVTLHLITF